MEYPLIVQPLSDEDGGGYLARALDLPGCISDGDTPEEAVTNLRDAIACWIESQAAAGRPVPKPFSGLRPVATKEDVEAVQAKLEKVEAEIEEVSEQIENQNAWGRFGELAMGFDEEDKCIGGRIVC